VYAVIEQTTVHVYTISIMVPWLDSIVYNAVICSLPRSSTATRAYSPTAGCDLDARQDAP
jgi:hypothetical protein